MEKQGSMSGVIFDFDGTLVNLDLDIETTRRKLTDYFKGFGFKIYVRPIYPKIFETLAELRKNRSEKEVRSIRKEAFSLMDGEESKAKVSEIKGARELLKGLKNQGKKVAIISVNGEKIIRKVFKKFRFPEPEVIVGRETIKVVKPNPKVGEYVLDKLNLKPNEVLLVGDTDYDIELASKLGMKSAWLKSSYKLSFTKPTFKIKKLKEILDII